MATYTAAGIACLVAALIIELPEAFKLGSCPPPSLKRRVAKHLACYPLLNFHCLYDSLEKKYSTRCSPAIRVSAGGYLYLEGNLNSRSCPQSRYQPKPYWSSDFNECVYQKSQCNGEGQVIHLNGSAYTDRFCRCDYRRGYDFLYKPKNPCYCKPSLEDCTCYLKKCSNNVKRLTPDYQCVSPGGLLMCPILPSIVDDSTTSTVNRPWYTSSFLRDIQLDKTSYNLSGRENGARKSAIIASVIIASVIIMIVVCIISLFVKELLVMKSLTDEEVSAVTEINLAMSDECYVEPFNYEEIKHVIRKEKLLILTGRKGSGKLTIALHLANRYLKDNFKCVLLRSENISQKLFLPRGNKKYLVVLKLSHSFDDLENKAEREQIHHLFGYSGEINIIFLAKSASLGITDILKKEKPHVSVEKVMFEIRYAGKEKEYMFDKYLKKYQTANACSSSERRKILDCEPYIGFPLMCFDFCIDPEVFKLGTLFFIQPPEKLVYEIDQMVEQGRNNIVAAYIYCVLVFIFTESKNGPVAVDNDKIEGLMSQIFNIQGKVLKTTIWKATHILLAKYVELNRSGLYLFQHQSIYDAILISYGSLYHEVVIRKSSLKSLMLLGRTKSYKPRKEETTLCLPFDRKDVLQEYTNRLLQELLESKETAANIGDYLKRFSEDCNDQILMKNVFERLSKAGHMSEKNTMQVLEFFSRFLDIPYDVQLTSDLNLSMFIASGYALSAHKYNNMKALEQVVNDIIHSDLETKFLLTKVDKLDNTVLHYFCVWCYEREERFLLKLLNSISGKQSPFKPVTKNCKGQSPFDIITYLGRPEVFEGLVLFFKNAYKKPNSFVAPELIKLVEKGQKNATKAVSINDSQLSVDFAFCREVPVFASSTIYTAMINLIDRHFSK